MTLEQTKNLQSRTKIHCNIIIKMRLNLLKIQKSVEFHSVQGKFLSCLSAGSYILDFGCGSGRDSKYFSGKKVIVSMR